MKEISLTATKTSAKELELLSKPRSEGWPAVRRAHLKLHPKCAVCEGTKKLQVHHCAPFHIQPELELDPSNLITLCESGHGGVICHEFIGHLSWWVAYNPNVREDAAEWNRKLKNRPLLLPK